jgi:hypothetical protein
VKLDNEGMKRKVIIALALVFSSLTALPAAMGATTLLGSISAITTTLDQGTVTVVPPTTNSPGAFTLSFDNPAIATANGLVVTLLSPGTTRITFTQAASGAYGSATRTVQFYVRPGTPTLGAFASKTVLLNVGSVLLTAPTSNSKGSWSYTSSDPTIASVTGNKVTLLDGGKVIITATQAATAEWLTATTTMELTITAVTPTLGTFTNITLTIDSIAKVDLTPPSSNSVGGWTFTSSNPSVAKISGVTLTPLQAGTTTITAKQSPSGGFSSSKTSMVVTVLAADPIVGTLNDITVVQNSTSSPSISLVVPTSNSTGTWTLTSSDPKVVSIDGNNAQIIAPGKSIITAKQAASAKFGPSKPVTMIFTVKGTPTYSVLPNLEKLAGDPDVVITNPVSKSDGAWSYVSSDSKIATISGNTIKLGDAGLVTITLTQAAATYWVAGSTQFTIRVLGVTPTIGTFDAQQISMGDSQSKIKNPTSNSPGQWSYSVLDEKVAKVVNGVVVAVAPGKTTLSATQAPGGKYGQSNMVQTTLTVIEKAITPTPSPTPSATATPKPSVPVVTTTALKVVVVKRVMTISVTGTKTGLRIRINGVNAKIGKNTVSAGTKTVIATLGTKVIYMKAFVIK